MIRDRIEPTASAPNLIGGAPINAVGPGVVGATLGGGATNNVQAMSHKLNGDER